MHLRTLTIAISASLFAACNAGNKPNNGGDSATTRPLETATTPEAATPAGPATPKVFNYNAIAVSDKPLGEFPFFNLPEGYKNYSQNKVVDFDLAYYWVGDHFERPEGKIFYNRITASEGKSYSDLELARNLEAVITEAGGVKVFEGKVPVDSPYVIPDDHGVKYMSGYGFIANAPSKVYLIRRADRNIWVQLTPTDDASSAGLMILETKPMKITASLIKAEEMKKKLDAEGHVALYINFDTDKATIKAESQPVIDEMQKLLAANVGLKVAIEGHTDNSGAATRNKKLSEERANAVKAALTGKGIDAARMQAKGFGAEKPVADNNSEDGKARNRRVEIVKI